MSTPKRRLYTGEKQTKRLIVLADGLDQMMTTIAATEGTTINSVYTAAALNYAERWQSSQGVTNTVDLFGAAMSSVVRTDLDNFSTRYAAVRDAYANAVDKLSGKEE